MRRLSIPSVLLLAACLAVLPACGKKKPAEDNSGGDPAPTLGPAPGPGTPPATATSDHFLFAQLNAKAIRDSSIFTEVKQAVLQQQGGSELWSKLEKESAEDLGVSVTDVESVTACVPEASKGEPKFVTIVTASKPFGKTKVFGYTLKTPDSRGLYPAEQVLPAKKPGGPPSEWQTISYIHFPDDKTAVWVHADLVQKYLDGYAKNRSSWPMSASLTQAASGHTAYATANLQKLPTELKADRDAQEFAPVLAAQAVTFTADLKEKQLSVAGRATFPDATTAGKAKDTVQKFVGLFASEVQKVLDGKKDDIDFASLPALKPVVAEAHRAIKEAKVEVSGSDLTLATSYKADFDIAKLVAEVVKQIRESAPRQTAQNNLRQIGLGMHVYSDMNRGILPIHGVGANGAPLTKATDTPLLSWRVAILPYIEQDNLYKQFKLNEPWDSEHNKKFIEQMPKIFAPVNGAGKAGHTHLQMVVGQGALQPGLTLNTITDGTSSTIAVLEAREPVIWTKPDDVMVVGKIEFADLRKKFGGQFPGGFNTVLWDGTPKFIPDTMSDRTLWQAINPADGQIMPAEWWEKQPLGKK